MKASLHLHIALTQSSSVLNSQQARELLCLPEDIFWETFKNLQFSNRTKIVVISKEEEEKAHANEVKDKVLALSSEIFSCVYITKAEHIESLLGKGYLTSATVHPRAVMFIEDPDDNDRTIINSWLDNRSGDWSIDTLDKRLDTCRHNKDILGMAEALRSYIDNIHAISSQEELNTLIHTISVHILYQPPEGSLDYQPFQKNSHARQMFWIAYYVNLVKSVSDKVEKGLDASVLLQRVWHYLSGEFLPRDVKRALQSRRFATQEQQTYAEKMLEKIVEESVEGALNFIELCLDAFIQYEDFKLKGANLVDKRLLLEKIIARCSAAVVLCSREKRQELLEKPEYFKVLEVIDSEKLARIDVAAMMSLAKQPHADKDQNFIAIENDLERRYKESYDILKEQLQSVYDAMQRQ